MSKSTQKAMRVAEKKRMRNKSANRTAKTYVAKAETLISAGEKDAAQEAVVKAVSVLDKVAQKRVIHRNCAARRKSRLMKKLTEAFPA